MFLLTFSISVHVALIAESLDSVRFIICILWSTHRGRISNGYRLVQPPNAPRSPPRTHLAWSGPGRSSWTPQPDSLKQFGFVISHCNRRAWRTVARAAPKQHPDNSQNLPDGPRTDGRPGRVPDGRRTGAGVWEETRRGLAHKSKIEKIRPAGFSGGSAHEPPGELLPGGRRKRHPCGRGEARNSEKKLPTARSSQ